jgi:hypothetical protein
MLQIRVYILASVRRHANGFFSTHRHFVICDRVYILASVRRQANGFFSTHRHFVMCDCVYILASVRRHSNGFFSTQRHFVMCDCVYILASVRHANGFFSTHRHFVICDLSSSTIFFTLSHKRNDFLKKKSKAKCVLIFSAILSETFLIIKKTQQYIITDIHMSCEVPFILVRF